MLMRRRNPVFFFFTRWERRALIVLALMAAGLVLVALFLAGLGESAPDAAGLDGQQEEAAYRDFRAGLLHQERERRERAERRKEAWQRQETPLTPFPFNPNTADSLTFRRLGLPPWMARNIGRYRAKGGKFRRPEDFRKIYGLTDEQYAALHPFITIAPQDTVRPRVWVDADSTDSVRLQPVPKYEPGTVVDLNRADTLQLKMIPGIGSGIARLISGYRQQLGGFYRIEQLAEINLDHRQLVSWFSIDTAAIRRINLNRVGVDRLRRHPYFNFYQARVIVEHRRKNGPLESLKPLSLYEEFTAADLERISHYVCFE